MAAGMEDAQARALAVVQASPGVAVLVFDRELWVRVAAGTGAMLGEQARQGGAAQPGHP